MKSQHTTANKILKFSNFNPAPYDVTGTAMPDPSNRYRNTIVILFPICNGIETYINHVPENIILHAT